MESVEHMTHALQVAAKAMRTARENNRPPEVMNLLEQSRQRVLRVAKKEADADIESNGVKALAILVEGLDYPAALKVLRDTQVQWRQRGVIATNALAVLEAARAQVVEPDLLDPEMASWTYDYILTDLREKVRIGQELAQEYVALEQEAIQGAQVLGVTF